MLARPKEEVDELELSYVPDGEVGYVWDAQIEMIERGMSKGQADWGTSDDLLAEIINKESQLWVVHRGMEVVAVVVTAVHTNREMTKVFVKLIAGEDMTLWADLVIDFLRRYQEHAGADLTEASCRPGLAKFLKGKGWSQKAIVMELK